MVESGEGVDFSFSSRTEGGLIYFEGGLQYCSKEEQALSRALLE